MPSNHLILCHLLLLPSIFPSIRVFFRWPKYWSFSFSISPSNEYLGLISLRIDLFSVQFGSVQLLSCVQLFVTPWTSVHQASLSFTISQSLFKFMSTESVMPSNHLILCRPFSSCLQSFPASGSGKFEKNWRSSSNVGCNSPSDLRLCFVWRFFNLLTCYWSVQIFCFLMIQSW